MEKVQSLCRIVCTCAALFIFAVAQTGTATGVVTDAETAEPLVGANVILLETQWGAATDLRGEFSITGLQTGTYVLEASMIGYESVRQNVFIEHNDTSTIDFQLTVTVLSQPDVVVSAERLIEKTSVSAQSMDRPKLLKVHGVLEDPVRSVLAMPGFSSGGEFATWLCVRGGSPNENLWLLDWVPVYWPYHFGGMKSVFNTEMIEHLELYSGGFPPKYGDKLSSVINITSREGSHERTQGKGLVSLINALALVEGPLTPRGSYIVSVRRSYYDLVLGAEPNTTIPSFYDMQTRLSYELAQEHDLYFSTLISGENARVEFEDPAPGQPGSIEDYYFVTSSSAEWNWLVTPKLYSMCAIIFQSANLQMEMNQWWLHTRVYEPGIREDLTWEMTHTHTLKTGFELRAPIVDWESFIPLNAADVGTWADTTLQGSRRAIKDDLYLGGMYVQDSWDITPRLSTNFGVRYDNNSLTKRASISPRASFRFDVDVVTALRAAHGYYYQIQEIHEMAENSNLDAKLARHYILGFERMVTPDVRSWIEVYYKDYEQLPTVDTNGHYTNEGYGYARGIEFFVQKKGEPLSGWVSYSLSWAQRKEYLDDSVNWFDYDQRHIVSATIDYSFADSWYLGLQWRFATGKPYTPIILGIRDTLGNWRPVNGEKNSERLSDFHRLDVSLNKEFSWLGMKPVVFIKLLNAYNRKNLIGYTYSFGADGTPIPEPYYGISIIPAIGFSVEF
ncbi:hypothetical protein AMJ87_12905 [candidate division WOR_3 bacterium SM23_60]|uniref:TonB-dependent receptor plug domain-containing protein n=1 Tax=candidate division WOR_3 bacterium SM23_60 TaxID=1703780 RepID=A0A0S8G433_UNCW3|nr:MAG: hypothetical protein AMJ87_12905 [candidate division WOR_3 bacterium SM23_60]